MSLRLHEVVPGRPTAKSKQNTDVLTVAQRGFIVGSILHRLIVEF